MGYDLSGMKALTDKQSKFAEVLASNPGLSLAEAARRAGYAPVGAKVTGCRLAQDPRIVAAIRMLRGNAPAVKLVRRELEGPPSKEYSTMGCDERRQWTLHQMYELAEQRDNLNVAFKACEFLARAYRLPQRLADAEDAIEPGGDAMEGMDLDRAKRIRAAASIQ